MFLEYNWLVKHNPEVNWDRENMVYKMPKKVQNTILEYYIYVKD